MCVSSASPSTMSEGWQEWPILGPGWKRRTVTRKSGASSGLSDTYYQSPSGQRFRSRNELSKFLGDSVDLSCFDFKSGTILPAGKRKPLRVYVRTAKTVKGASETPPKKQRTSLPKDTDQDLQNGKDVEPSQIVCCRGCNTWFTGVLFGKSKQTVWYCADCRASRRADNKLQKQLKSSGCGLCTACRVTENCGHCSVCLLRSQNPEFGSSWKCVRRRCLQVIRKGGVCGRCPGCSMKEDCKTCTVCVAKQKTPEISDKCLKRWCHNKKHKLKPPPSKKLTKKLNMGGNCGHCIGCCTLENCGACSLCIRKRQNPGRKIKGKCLKRRCHNKKKKIKVKPKIGLKAKEKNIPLYLKSSNHPILVERIQKEAAEASENVEAMGTCGGWVIGGVDTKGMKQEIIIDDEDDEQPLDLHCPLKPEEFVTEDDDVMLADESTPVIMEIFSLGAYNSSNGIDLVLQEFMEELNEIPLPAHWELMPLNGPNLHLVQRSRMSTMSETIIHILPGLHFNVAVRNYTVPASHELFRKHPSRLTTVDEVVELICDLEAYRPCAGLPKSGPCSPSCSILVYEERCPECCTMPWPSGNYH
ncbi:methyl-CpG-binding domain protein 1 isoform X6 [Bufo bufo]|uniref:methyl-CpG-binding domain protein 1 isoform X6 n=1 Tax=Bufo bufo TaxID=8384 RepID=UPI001ABDBF07|nr:methyl-CpG-binding domain protein 1 isoform X6 [Bufo bufo]